MYNNLKLKHTIIFLLAFSAVLAQPKIPELEQYATDLTGTLKPSQLNRIDSYLKAFEDSTSNQLLFLMIPSLQGYPLENYTYEVAMKNKIGTKRHDNGVLFFVSKNDRKMRIEVGYGLEGALPDALASSILRNEVRPYFRNGDYYSGIINGIVSIVKATEGEYKGSGNSRRGNKKNKFPFVLIFWIIIFIISMFKRRRNGGRGGGIFFLGGGGMLGGGSLGGGGFGGFSGGGGSFGGGGASGGW